MATYVPAKKNTAFVFYVALRSQANSAIFQANPTLAAGDVKVSIDGGAFANLSTLPAVTPAAGKAVKVDLSASEMNGDNIMVVFSDAAGAEWMDLVVNIQTVARQIDDLAFPLTSGRGLEVEADNMVRADTREVTGTAQTAGDIFARLGAPAGASMSADIAAVKAETASIQADTNDIQTRLPAALVAGRMASNAEVVGDKTGYSLAVGGAGAGSIAAAERNNLADALLDRDMSVGTDSGGRTVRNALRALRNKTAIAAGTLTVYKEDDATPAWTATVTTAAGNPLASITPV